MTQTEGEKSVIQSIQREASEVINVDDTDANIQNGSEEQARRKGRWLGSYSKITTALMSSFLKNCLFLLGVIAVLIVCTIVILRFPPSTESLSTKSPVEQRVTKSDIHRDPESSSFPIIIRQLGRESITVTSTTAEPIILSQPSMTVSMAGKKCYELSRFFVCRLKNLYCVTSTIDFNSRQTIDIVELLEKPVLNNSAEELVFDTLCRSKYFKLKV